MKRSRTEPGSGRSWALEAELLPVAAKVCWWCAPGEALEDLPRFLAQVMTYGDWQDVRTAMGAFGEEALQAVLDNAPPGVFDVRSWNYWHRYFGRMTVPDLPRRRL
jgi:hypothetical protein